MIIDDEIKYKLVKTGEKQISRPNGVCSLKTYMKYCSILPILVGKTIYPFSTIIRTRNKTTFINYCITIQAFLSFSGKQKVYSIYIQHISPDL